MKQLYLYISSAGNEWLIWDTATKTIKDSGALTSPSAKPHIESADAGGQKRIENKSTNHNILELDLDCIDPNNRALPCTIILSGQYIQEFNFDLIGGSNKSQSAALLEISQELSQSTDDLYISYHNAHRQHWSLKVICKSLINELLVKTNSLNINLQGIIADYDLLPLKGARTLMRTDTALLVRQANEFSTLSNDVNACKSCRSASIHDSFLPFWIESELTNRANQDIPQQALEQHWLNDKTMIENDSSLQNILQTTDTFETNQSGTLSIEKLIHAFYTSSDAATRKSPLLASPLNSRTQLLTPSALGKANIDPALLRSISNSYVVSSPSKIIFWLLLVSASTILGLEYF